MSSSRDRNPSTPQHHVSVAGVAVREDGRVLAIRRADNGAWQAPGGVLERDEAIEDGVVREVFEETGIKVRVDRLTGVYKNMALGVVAMVFRCTPESGHEQLSDESTAVAWLTPDEVVRRMDEAFAVRVTDALLGGGPRIRAHDGRNLTGGRGSLRLMHAITIAEPGGPEALVWAEVPEPEAAEGEVLVEVAAGAVNRADVLQRQGFYDPPPGASPYPGLECSGRITAVGPGVAGWSVGDEVCALLAGGGYAERVAVPAGQLLPVPDGVGLVEAAALPEVACTVWSNVFMTARLRSGETLLVHGGGSGIGTMAIQLAKASGARVAVTAGSAEKLERCRALGADVLVNYREQDFAAAVKEATGGRGADVILDIMGASYLAANVDTLAVNGRLAVIGLQGGARAELDLRKLLSKRAAVSATSLRGRPLTEKAAIVAEVRERVWPLIADGRVSPVVHEKVPMREAAAAHRTLEAGGHVGKILLVV